MQRARIIIKGDVQMVGFRGFVIEQMKSLNLKGYAGNLPDETVEVLCEGLKDNIEKLIAKIRVSPPRFATVDSAEPEWQEYIGNLKEPERRGEDVPKKATLDDVVKVLTKMDMKLEIGNERLGSIDGKQDKMLEKQDQTISEIKNGFSKMDQNFNRMDVKYDKVSNKLDKIDEKLNSLDRIDRTLERLTTGILKLAEKA